MTQARLITIAFVIAGTLRAQYMTSVVAGGAPNMGAAATSAYLVNASAVAANPQGGFYFATHTQVFRVNSSGVIDLVLGGNGGTTVPYGSLVTAPTVFFNGVSALAVDSAGNLYICEGGRIDKVDAVTGIISLYGGTGATSFNNVGDGLPATQGNLGGPRGMAFDGAGNLYIADDANNRIRKITASTGIISTVAGNGTAAFSKDPGPGTSTSLNRPWAVAVDAAGNLYIAEYGNNALRKMTAATGIMSTLAGSGPGADADTGDSGLAANANLNHPIGIVLDSAGNIYVQTAASIRKIDHANGNISTLAGITGEGLRGQLAIDASNNILVADQNNYRILRIDGASTSVTIVAGKGLTHGVSPYGDNDSATNVVLPKPRGLALDSTGSLYIGADGVRKVSAKGVISTLAGVNESGANSKPLPLSLDAAGNLYFIDIISGSILGSQTLVRKVAAGGGTPVLVAGGGTLSGTSADGGPATSAYLGNASDVLVKGNNLYIADGDIRKVDLTTGIISTILPGASAGSIDMDSTGNLYFQAGNTIRKLEVGSSSPSTVAGTGTYPACSIGPCDPTSFGLLPGAQLGDGGPAIAATLNGPKAVRVDRSGNLFIADTGAHRVRVVSAATGLINTIAGTNAAGCSHTPGSGANSHFAAPAALAIDRAGGIYVADQSCGGVVAKLTSTNQGYLDAVTCDSISGWAADTSQKNVAISVSIYDGTTLLATVLANQPRADVGVILGDNGAHGFSYTPPVSVRDGQSHNIHVVFANGSGLDLPNSPKPLTCATAAYAGYVDSSSCSGISGWAADRARLNQAITVTLWDGGLQVASTTANSARSDVGTYLGDNGLHGFSFAIPSGYADSYSHTLQVRYETTATQLPGSPVSFKCGSPSGDEIYQGYIDTVSCSGISGWLVERVNPNVPVTASLATSAALVTSTTANGYRSDVAALIHNNGYNGFSLAIPPDWANGISHTYTVYANGHPFMGSAPITLTCGSAPNHAGWVDHAGCDGISGWAADKNRPNQPISIDIFNNGGLLTTVLANASRPDVGGVLGDNGAHGFSLPLPPLLQDGRTHNLSLTYTGTSDLLNNGQQVVKLCSAGPVYTGYVDQVSCSSVSGWAADLKALNTSVSVSLFDGDTFLSNMNASSPRSDVGTYLGDNGLHGFSFVVPPSLKDGAQHFVNVRASSNSQRISPDKPLTCQP